MLIHDLLSPERISLDLHAGSKKRLLELISEKLADNSSELDQREVFDSLVTRERLATLKSMFVELRNGFGAHGRSRVVTAVRLIPSCSPISAVEWGGSR